METVINTWMSTNKEIVQRVGLNVENLETEALNVMIGGYKIQITMPCSFENICSSDPVKSDAFLALSLEEDYDDRLTKTLLALNEKIERVRMNTDCLARVFDTTVQVFDQYKCLKPSKQDEGGSQRRGSEKQPEPYIYSIAEDARLECEAALFLADENSISDNILQWCSVLLVPIVESVQLEVEIKGIMGGKNLASAIGFCLDDPLVIQLRFGHDEWSAKEPCLDSFQHAHVVVRQNEAKLKQFQLSVENAVIGLDGEIRDAILRKCSSRTTQYGPHVLVPELVKDYFLRCSMEYDGNLNTIQPASAHTKNILVGLLNFLGSQLKALQNWCALCKKELPPFSRLWYCNDPLCVYRFEELGVGTSVLHELLNTELTDFELTLAAAATTQSRDVFEPYPTFLLEKAEIRDRSGFFSDYIADQSKQRNYLANKKLDLLRKIFDAIPPLTEMQKCSTEIELAVKLGIQWLKTNSNSYTNDKCDVEYADDFWLTYNVVKYVMFTNRSSLQLIQHNSALDIKGTHYQFAVFYDSKAEQDFEGRRETEGSVFAFHGSGLFNWYSIIRNGLRCLSKTKYMSAGNAFGDGIYFSTSIAESYRYASVGTCLVFGSSKTYSVVALCEILSGHINSKSDSHVLVVPPENQKDVVIRYLLVFGADSGRGDAIAVVKEGHMLSGKTDLHDHYLQLRTNHSQRVSREECMELINRRKQNLGV